MFGANIAIREDIGEVGMFLRVSVRKPSLLFRHARLRIIHNSVRMIAQRSDRICPLTFRTSDRDFMPSTFLVIGAGLMGPAAAYNALRDPGVDRVILADRKPELLEQAAGMLGSIVDTDRLERRRLNLADREEAVSLLREADVVLTALPWNATVMAVRAALEADVPLVDLAIPDDDEMAELRRETEEAGGRILLGCGLEPGLTEIEARRLAGKLDSANEFHIMVGGIPKEPSGPLNYRIVFGGDQLPLRWIDALVVEEGEKKMLRRYSGVERTEFGGVGEVEAWNEGVIPWLLDLPEFSDVRAATQKTIRWPGYAERASTLNELGLLGTEPVQVGDVSVVPKDLVDEVLRPHVTMRPEDRDITLFRVTVGGELKGENAAWRTEMVDRFDEETGITSMARTTAFTGAILARMILHGTITVEGLQTPDLLVTGDVYDVMIEELAKEGVTFRTERLV